MENKKKGFICIAVTTLLFSSMEIALKFISGDFNPVQLTFSRFLVGGLVLLPFAMHALKEKGIRPDSRTMARFALLGFIGIFISMIMYQLAVCNAKASVVAVLFSSNPVFVMFFAFILLSEPIMKNNIASLGLDILGILFIINPFETKISMAGIVFTIVATLTFALYGVMGKKQCAKFGGVVVTCFGFLFGAVEIMAAAAVTHAAPVAGFMLSHGLVSFADIPFFTGYSLSNIAVVLFVYVGVTGIGYASYFKAMEYTSANTASLVFFFKPAIAPLFAFIILNEAIPFNMLAGIGFILVGSLVSIAPALMAARRSVSAPLSAEETAQDLIDEVEEEIEEEEELGEKVI
ncbi:MAG: DMT family transporter [Eubacteriaceae bacterium]|jgi:drug/metabolite transporter (DMT)-like permease|nr:DMT family transporter [Eubacteriaceae bacterium]